MYVEIRVSEGDKLLYTNYTFGIEQVTRPGTPARRPLADRKPCIFLCHSFKIDFCIETEVKGCVLSTQLIYDKTGPKLALRFAGTDHLPDLPLPLSLSLKFLMTADHEELFSRSSETKTRS